MDELIGLDTLLNTVRMASLIWIPIKSSTLNWSRLYLISAYFKAIHSFLLYRVMKSCQVTIWRRKVYPGLFNF